jgi:hypothetical protein
MTDVQRVELSALLIEIEKNEHDHEVRNIFVHKAIVQAMEMGYIAGYEYLASHPNGIVACLELPYIGMVTWIVPSLSKSVFYSSNVEENQRRCRLYIESNPYEEASIFGSK